MGDRNTYLLLAPQLWTPARVAGWMDQVGADGVLFDFAVGEDALGCGLYGIGGLPGEAGCVSMLLALLSPEERAQLAGVVDGASVQAAEQLSGAGDVLVRAYGDEGIATLWFSGGQLIRLEVQLPQAQLGWEEGDDEVEREEGEPFDSALHQPMLTDFLGHDVDLYFVELSAERERELPAPVAVEVWRPPETLPWSRMWRDVARQEAATVERSGCWGSFFGVG